MKFNKHFFSAMIGFMIFFSSFTILLNITSQVNISQEPLVNPSNLNSKGSISYSQQWLTNPSLSAPIEPTWYSTIYGDLSDVDAIDGQGQANITVVGNSGVISVVENKDSWTPSNWRTAQNPSFPVQPTYILNTGGAAVSYTWDENADQTGNAPSGLFKRQVNVGLDMADYSVTYASLQAEINASVNANVEAPSEGGAQFDVGDIIRWYILLSDKSGTTSYEVAWNQSRELGDGAILTMGDTLMVNVSNQILAVFLESILGIDSNSFNITLGINVICEDNNALYDVDTFNYLRFTTFNLTFAYEKKIAQTTYAAWSQQGNMLPQGNIVVDSASLFFKYRLDSGNIWPSAKSPNSEIRMLINNISHSETVKLSKANETYQDGKASGFDVTTLIPKSKNITLTLQVYLADNFDNPSNVTISFDEVYLWINYTITFLEPLLTVSANSTYLYTNQVTQITVQCQNQTPGQTEWLAYTNPFTPINVTLATNFAGLQTFLLNFTSASAGPRTFKFYANSSDSLWAYKELTVVWVTPLPPTLLVTANKTSLYTDRWSQLTVSCTNGSGIVDTLFYENPFDNTNYTLANDFTGTVIRHLNFTSSTADAYLFRCWANTSFGLWAYDDITVVWTVPTGPTITLIANITSPYTGYGTQIRATCQGGTERTDRFFYTNPFDLFNYTLNTNFTGASVHYLNFSSALPGSYKFSFYANSTLGLQSSVSISIVWVEPVAPILTVGANTTTPFTNFWTELLVTCQAGDGFVDTLFYINPFDGENYTIATNFTGIQFHRLNFTHATPGTYLFQFFCNSSFDLWAFDSITIVWVTAISPLISASANNTNPFTNFWTQIEVFSQAGSANVSTCWYYNPIDEENHTIATNYAGSRTDYLNFTSATTRTLKFIFYINSTLGNPSSQTVTIVFVEPISPILTVVANTSNPFINDYIQLTVTCQAGSANVSRLWYYDAFDLKNYTLDLNFIGPQTYYLNFTSPSPGAFIMKFWANSTLGATAYQAMALVWVSPSAPLLSVNANTTSPYLDRWTQIQVLCQGTDGLIDVLWYTSPFDSLNYTIDTAISGAQIYYENFTYQVLGSFEFKFFANSTFGIESYDSIIISWVQPQAPSITLLANVTNPFINRWTNISVLVSSGTGTGIRVWYNDPSDGLNYTVGTNFVDFQTYFSYFIAATAGPRQIRFWVNNSFGLEVSQSIFIVWLEPQPPTVNVGANTTELFITLWTQVTVSCVSGTGDVSSLWYYSPFDDQNHTLDSAFSGGRIYKLNFTTTQSGTYNIKVYASSTFGLIAEDHVTVVFVLPKAPTIIINVSTYTPELDELVIITVTVTPGDGNIDTIWWLNPADGKNHTIANVRAVYTVNFTVSTAGNYEIKVWANDTYGVISEKSLTVTFVEPTTSPIPPWVTWTAVGAVAALAAALLSYQLYFKVPKTIRNIRNLKSNILKGQPSKPLDVTPRETMVDDTFNKVMRTKKLPTKKLEAPHITKKI